MTQMATYAKVCEDPTVNPRAILLGLLCLILAIVRIVGTHAHLEHVHKDGTALSVTTSEIVTTDEYSSDHLGSHLVHGDTDVGDSDQSFGKFFFASPDFIALFFLSTLLLLLEPHSGRRIRVFRPELRPPTRRRVFDLTPPAHAPPVAS